MHPLRTALGTVVSAIGVSLLLVCITQGHILWTGVQHVYVDAPKPPTPPMTYTNTGDVLVDHRYHGGDEVCDDCATGQYQFRDPMNKIFLMNFCSTGKGVYPNLPQHAHVDITYETKHGECYTFDFAKVISEEK